MQWGGAIVTGHALCVASIDDCTPCKDGGYEWHLSHIRPIVPVPVKGQLNIFNVDITPRLLSSYDEARQLYLEMGLIAPEHKPQ